MGGNMNSTPTDDILQVLSAHHGAMILHPGTADAPESTRWESNRCIDWSIQKGFQVQPYCRREKPADHKVLCSSVASTMARHH